MKIKGILSSALVLSASLFLLSGCYSMKLINQHNEKTVNKGAACVKSQTPETNALLADAR